MIKNFDDVKKITEENTKKVVESTSVVTKGVQAIAAEAADFSKKALEANTAAIQELAAAKSIDKVVELQMSLGKKAYEDAVAYSTKVNELSLNLIKDAFKPFENMFANVANVPAKSSKAA